ncbi:MAG: hypothetical protein R3D25_12340 [Geminicoccaceae bacterium]
MTELLEVRLDDKYRKDRGRVFMTGVQALVRLPMEQHRRDAARGWQTGGYITGYRGSPLGAYDQELQNVRPLLEAHHIHHQPGVNEDLAATACQGTQQVHLLGPTSYDGVFAIWYAKGPGVDRSGDAVRHGHLFGTHPKGGVLLLLGDDHICESSTTAHQSEFAMVDAMVPILNPSGVAEILDYGLLGIAMSRFTGGWVSLKCVHDTVECTASSRAGPGAAAIADLEETEVGPGPRHIDLVTDQPCRRWPASSSGGCTRPSSRRPGPSPAPMASTGSRMAGPGLARHRHHRQVLARRDGGARGAGPGRCEVPELGPAVCWLHDLPPGAGRARARHGRDRARHGGRGEARPRRGADEGAALCRRPSAPIIGKADERGAPLFLARPARQQPDRHRHRPPPARAAGRWLRGRLAGLEAVAGASFDAAAMARLPHFCAGCPHSSSTRVPEGSRAMAGIGCHYMVNWMDRATSGFTQMGGEWGSGWGGAVQRAAAPSRNISTWHVLPLGLDGGPGRRRVRQSITLKILVNDAVAMTGGQKMEIGNLDAAAITRLLEAEGVQEVVVVSDQPGKYPIGTRFAPGVRLHHRDELDAVQRRLRGIAGVTAIVYDQTCAAEKRRRRKQGTMVDPDERVVINEAVCEGCGDCGVQSNCVAATPVETEPGRARDGSTSPLRNKDFSCLKGFARASSGQGR